MTTPPEADSGQPAVAELAEACVRFVREATGFALDYSPETLPVLDHFLKAHARGAKPEVRELLAAAAGAYFGEVARRSLGGAHWHCPSDDYASYRLQFAPFFLHFNPIGVAVEAIEGSAVPEYRAHFQVLEEARAVVEQSLEAIDDVRDEDYYTLAVRYEVLDQCAAVLAALESQADSRRVFGPEVYRALNDGPKGDSEPPS